MIHLSLNLARHLRQCICLMPSCNITFWHLLDGGFPMSKINFCFFSSSSMILSVWFWVDVLSLCHSTSVLLINSNQVHPLQKPAPCPLCTNFKQCLINMPSNSIPKLTQETENQDEVPFFSIKFFKHIYCPNIPSLKYRQPHEGISPIRTPHWHFWV